MDEGQRQALEAELVRGVDGEYGLADPCDEGYRPAPEALVKYVVMPIVERELAARDAVIAEALRIVQASSRAHEDGHPAHLTALLDAERFLSSLPSTGETSDG